MLLLLLKFVFKNKHADAENFFCVSMFLRSYLKINLVKLYKCARIQLPP